MNSAQIETNSPSDFSRLMDFSDNSVSNGAVPKAPHLNINPENVQKGLGQLVLTVVKLLHELLERQAIRRIDAGSLTENEIEAVGFTLMRQAEEIERLREAFGLKEGDLNIDLGPLGKLL